MDWGKASWLDFFNNSAYESGCITHTEYLRIKGIIAERYPIAGMQEVIPPPSNQKKKKEEKHQG